MKGVGGSAGNHEAGLSEVVGFVLIIAVITVAFSLYLAYGVPAQGRENEILHMGMVKDQFISYKIGLDSLATNDKVGTTLSNSFTLGSEGGYTQGVMSFIPIMNPVGSGGTFSINRRTTDPETLTITSQSLVDDRMNRTSVDLPATADFIPSHVYANVSIGSTAVLDGNSVFGMVVNTTQWTALVNLTPQVTFYQWYQKVTPPGGSSSQTCDGGSPDLNKNGTAINVLSEYNPATTTSTYTCLVPMNAYAYNGTDVTVTIFKGNAITMDKYPVYKNVQRSATYTVDLMDTTYGLNSLTDASSAVSLQVDQPLSQVTGNGNITYNFVEKTYTSGPITLGAVDYRSQNNYWISQEYYYQMGGVFLSQIDGNNTYKLPPEISFSMDISNPSRPITRVTVNAVSITNPYGGSVVGGNSPVQIKTTLDSLDTFPYAEGTANTKWIRIGISTPDDQARAMWKNYFDYTAKVAGLPTGTETGVSGAESYIIVHGSDAADTGDYDIKAVATNATYTALLYGVGG